MRGRRSWRGGEGDGRGIGRGRDGWWIGRDLNLSFCEIKVVINCYKYLLLYKIWLNHWNFGILVFLRGQQTCHFQAFVQLQNACIDLLFYKGKKKKTIRSQQQYAKTMGWNTTKSKTYLLKTQNNSINRVKQIC